jgi:site-specific DNA-methyltransferase (adenine-specific)
VERGGGVKYDPNHFYCVDALEGLRALPPSSVDLIVTDPPYNTQEKWRAMGTTTRLSHSKSSSNDWMSVVSFEYLEEVIGECFRILRKPGHLYVMGDYTTCRKIDEFAKEVGFELRKPLVWEKVGKTKDLRCPFCKIKVGEVQSRGTPGMSYPYRSCYEMIHFSQKGRRPAPENCSVRNVLRVPWLKGKNYYPTEKPVELMEVLIQQASQKGDLVLDPFAGSGSVLRAARNQGRAFLGFDINPGAKSWFEGQRDVIREPTPPPKPPRRPLSFVLRNGKA